ncbi:MAG: AMP-binding protein [Thermomicrobiales bacterium]
MRIAPGEDIAVLLCSSGTTGLPKGVMLTHRAVISMGLMMTGPDGIKEDDVLPGQLPLFHAFGVMVTMSAGPATGATSVLLTQPDFGQFLRLVHDYAPRAPMLHHRRWFSCQEPTGGRLRTSRPCGSFSPGPRHWGADVEQIAAARR